MKVIQHHFLQALQITISEKKKYSISNLKKIVTKYGYVKKFSTFVNGAANGFNLIFMEFLGDTFKSLHAAIAFCVTALLDFSKESVFPLA